MDDQIIQEVIDGYIRPVGRGLMMTGDLRALYHRTTSRTRPCCAP
ncbi:hypothetical protein ACFY04_43640 [Streptomyces sp. NPDC001549]